MKAVIPPICNKSHSRISSSTDVYTYAAVTALPKLDQFKQRSMRMASGEKLLEKQPILDRISRNIIIKTGEDI
jgi:hypothetical protein